MEFEFSKRLQSLPPYLFLEIDKAKRKARSEGRDIIDFGIGDPDQPTPEYIIDSLNKASHDPANHRYALDQGMPRLRSSIAQWYKNRFNVPLDTDTEILPLIGSKEGIAHFPLAFINPGDYSLVPDPCYPPYKGGTIFAGGNVHIMPLAEENKFLPDFSKIPADVLKKAKLLYINYPNNPTGAVADEAFYKGVVAFAKKHGLIVISDLAYSEMSYDGYRPLSFLEVEGARDVAIEFHSHSKTFNMTGWRVGWACGNKKLVAGLAKVKSNIDSGIFSAIQVSAVTALDADPVHVSKMCDLYQERRDVLVDGLNKLGWKASKPKATFYVWVKVPPKLGSNGLRSVDFAAALLEKADLVVTPGVGFGASGEGYVRFALTVPKERVTVALERLKKVM